MHEPPRDEFAELLAELCILQQGPGVDLRVSTGGHPLIQQGGVVQHIGVTLNVRDQRQDALFLQSVQGLLDKMRLMGGWKLNEHVGGVAHAEGLGVQLTELGRKVNFAAQLEPEVHRLFFQCLGQPRVGGGTLFQKSFHRGALAVEMAGERDVAHAVLILLVEQLQRDRDIFGTVVNTGQDMAVQISHGSLPFRLALRAFAFPGFAMPPDPSGRYRRSSRSYNSCKRSWSP